MNCMSNWFYMEISLSNKTVLTLIHRMNARGMPPVPMPIPENILRQIPVMLCIYIKPTFSHNKISQLIRLLNPEA